MEKINKNIKTVIKGLLTGLFLQMAIGPVFFYIINITLQNQISNAMLAVLAVTLADYIYIILALFGLGELMSKQKCNRWLTLVSSIVLLTFGTIIINKASPLNNISNINNFDNGLKTFFNVFILTFSSPVTIIFWTSVFTTKALEHNYKRKELFIFGLSAGMATPLFLSTTVYLFSIIKTNIPSIIIYYANIIVGTVLILYGIIRLISKYCKKNKFIKI